MRPCGIVYSNDLRPCLSNPSTFPSYKHVKTHGVQPKHGTAGQIHAVFSHGLTDGEYRKLAEGGCSVPRARNELRVHPPGRACRVRSRLEGQSRHAA